MSETYDSGFSGAQVDSAVDRVLNAFEYPSKNQTELNALSYGSDKRYIFFNSTTNTLVRWSGSAWEPYANVNTSTGGDARGADAVDFQYTRTASSNVASGPRSFVAGGNSNTASGTDAIASGDTTTASGDNSAAFGDTTTASGAASLASGNSSEASGINAVATGANTVASAANSFAMGENAQATNRGEVVTGTTGVSGTAQLSHFLLTTQTTNDTPTELLIGGSGGDRITLPGPGTYKLTLEAIVASSTGADTPSIEFYDCTMLVTAKVNGTMARLGHGANRAGTYPAETDPDIELEVDDSLGYHITVTGTGMPGVSADWLAHVQMLQLIHP